MRINTQTVLKNLKGEPLQNEGKDYTLGDALANILSVDQTGGKMKLWLLAQKFSTNKEVELDTADLALVKTAAENTKSFTPLLAGQVLCLLEETPDSNL